MGLCFKWGYTLGAQPVVQYARDLHVRDFEQGNFVVIDSRRGNPLASLFDNEVNFVVEEVPATHSFHFRIRKPVSGEPATYELVRESDGTSTGYVDIVVLPNLTHSGTVLVINGFSIETHEAAAHLIFDKAITPDSSRGLTPELSRAINSSKSNSKLENLMRMHNLDSSENGSEIVAIRMDSDNAAH